MSILKRIILFPIFVLVAIMATSVKILIKVECWVAGVGFLLLAIFAILALINQMWLQLGIFITLFIVGVLIMLMSAHVQLAIDELQRVLKSL